MSTTTRSLLFVCDGNLARSPAAQFLARHRAGTDGEWEFTSCGVRAVRSDQVLTAVAEALGERGVACTPFHSRQADPGLLQRADLILTAGHAQAVWIAEEAPGAFRRTFTIRQAARLLADRPEGGDAVQFLTGCSDRSGVQDEIADPFRQGREAAYEAVQQIDEALGVVIPALVTAPR